MPRQTNKKRTATEFSADSSAAAIAAAAAVTAEASTSRKSKSKSSSSSAPAAALAVEDPAEELQKLMKVVNDRMGGGGFIQVASAPGDEEEEDDGDEKPLTKEQIARLRYIHTPADREKAMDRMEKSILGSQANESFMMFDTSFSYHVFAFLTTKIPQISKNKDKKKAFNDALGVTSTISEYDCWMMDNEDPEEVDNLMQKLAAVWKSLLQCSNDTLGIDEEFTRPAVEQVLTNLANTLQSVDVDFKWK